MSLTYIGEQCTIYGGYFLLLAGIFGNGMNIFIFSSEQNYRRTPSSFYLLAGSVCNGLYVGIILTTRILGVGYGIDLTLTSIVWCRIRQFLINSLGPISFTCSSLVTIDQFLVTSRRVSLRLRSKIEYAHRIMFVMIIIWCFQAIPFFLYANIVPIPKICVTTNLIHLNYVVISGLIFLYIIPILIDVVFGGLTYYNISQTIILLEEHADRQLAKMILIQVVLIIISITPVGIYSSYYLATIGIAKDIDRLTKEAFVSTIIGLTSYFYYSGSFYVFLISSSRFRQTVKDRMIWWRRGNQIRPFQAH